jgi:predicted nucleotidyltransferase
MLIPEIKTVLQKLLVEVQALLGDHFTGLYLHGSLASGDFNPRRSDIDFLVVTTSELPVELLPQLAIMHTRLAASGLPWADKLEGSYIPQAALRRYDPTHAHHPALRIDGSFAIDRHGHDWVIQRQVLRQQGIILAGPPLQDLIDPIQPEDLRLAARATLNEWWAPMLDEPARLRSREYQAYAAITMCRILYTLCYGAVATKSDAARWAQTELGESWVGLIEQAMAWPEKPQPDRLEGTLALIRFTVLLTHSGIH